MSLNRMGVLASSMKSTITPYGVSAAPVAWYKADDLTSTTAGTVWPNAAAGNPGAVVANLTAMSSGNLVSNWRNGHKAFNSMDWQANISAETGLSQTGNFTMIAVSATDGVGFQPFFGVGEWWLNYSQAYGGYYAHGYYGNWGHFTATPAVVGLTHSSGSSGATVFSNSSYSSDSPGTSPQTPPLIELQTASTSDFLAEMLVYNTVLSNSDIDTITTNLRARFAF